MHISHLLNNLYKNIKKCHFSLLNSLKVLYNDVYIFMGNEREFSDGS